LFFKLKFSNFIGILTVPRITFSNLSFRSNEDQAKVRIGLNFVQKKVLSRSISEGQTINDFFQVDSVLGEGVSVVKKAMDRKTKQEVAIKFLNPKIVNKMKIKNEAEVMKNMKHPHIVKLWESLETENETYLVMELVRGCDLFDFLKLSGKISENIVGNIIYQILLAVDYIHCKGFAHCDLKPENILIDFKNQIIKVTDFDFAKKSSTYSITYKWDSSIYGARGTFIENLRFFRRYLVPRSYRF